MAQQRIVKVRGPNGEMFELDLYNETVRGADGWKVDTRVITQSDVHVAAALPDFVVGYDRNQPEAIADILCPPLLTAKPTDKYHIWNKDNKFAEATNLEVAGDAEIPVVSPQLSNTSFSVVDYGAAAFVNENVQMAADSALDPYMESVGLVMDRMVLARELRAKALMLDGTTTFASYKTALDGTTKWNGGASSDPIANLHAAVEACYAPPTHIGLSLRTWHTLTRHPDVKAIGLYKDSEGRAIPSADAAMQVADRLGLEGMTFVVGRMKYKDSNGAYSYIWGNDVILCRNPPGAQQSGRIVCTARTFRWAAPGSTMGYEIREWDAPSKGQRGGRMVAVVTSEVQQAVSVETGHLITGAYA